MPKCKPSILFAVLLTLPLFVAASSAANETSTRHQVGLQAPDGTTTVFETQDAFLPVSRTWTLISPGITELAVEGVGGRAYRIGTTPEHPFWGAIEEEWIPAIDLPIDASLATSGGGTHVPRLVRIP